MNTIYLLLGSNLGNRKENLEQAVLLFNKQSGKVLESSGIYETMPWGLTEQPLFYNQVLKVESLLSPPELLLSIQEIEKKMGRIRKIKWGERIIDIDILYYNDLILNTESLVIPHPEIQNRRFTLLPLAEIAQEMLHPLLQKSTAVLLGECKDELEVRRIEF